MDLAQSFDELRRCPVTFEKFRSSGQHAPYVTPCGHTLSKFALTQVRTSPARHRASDAG
jgi:hypothetical protein